MPSNAVTRADWLGGLFHPAVVWDETYDGQSDFCGIMLTHTPPSGRFNNILMSESHFEAGHQVVFSNTHFVNQAFIKLSDWGPFECVGRLTSDGIAFIENHLNQNSHPLEFTHYLAALMPKK